MAIAASCAREARPVPEADSTAATAVSDAPAPVVLPGGGGEPTCPMFAPWQACSVEERIYRAGLAVNRRPDGVRHDFLHVEGIVFETSRAEVQVFLYASEAARRRDTDQLDTVFVAPRGKRIYWDAPATLVTSQNLAAIVLSPNPRQAERIALALGAGLPAPPPK